MNLSFFFFFKFKYNKKKKKNKIHTKFRVKNKILVCFGRGMCLDWALGLGGGQIGAYAKLTRRT